MWRGLAVLVLAIPLLVPPPAEASAPWWATTHLDMDRDGVDDALAPLLTGSTPLVLLVDYATIPGERERADLEARGATVVTAYRNFPILAVRVAPEDARGLLDATGVVMLEANDVVLPMLKESVPLVGAPVAWQKYRATGKGIVVAVLDDGAYEQHPDLSPRLAGHYDAGAPSTPLDRPAAVDVMAPAGEAGHGTHVAGTVIGPGTESGGVYKGVAPDAKFVNVKVFSGPNQTTSDLVLKGLDWVVDHQKELGIRVAVMSLGGRPSDGKDALSRGVDIAVDRGLIVVASAGNAGPTAKTISSPGAAEKAITVGAVDRQKRMASFSSRGPTLDGRAKPDLVAPGVAIVSTVPPVSSGGLGNVLSGGRTTYYGALSGTSMAAPHVAGAVALMLQADPSLTPFEVKQILIATAQELGPAGVDADTGYGFLNAAAAVQVTKDPSILEQPMYKARLSTLPEPEKESLLTRLAFDAQTGNVGPLFLIGAGALLLGGCLVAWLILRQKPSI